VHDHAYDRLAPRGLYTVVCPHRVVQLGCIVGWTGPAPASLYPRVLRSGRFITGTEGPLASG